jgi:hypothetical protein
MKRAWIWLLRAFIVTAAIILLFFGVGLFELLSTSDESAKQHIQVVFEDECLQKGLNKNNYEGPYIKRKDFWHYEFFWKNSHNAQFVLGQIQFFPIQSEIWFLEPGAKI